MLCMNGNPEIRNNMFMENSAGAGGGICCGENSAPRVFNNIIRRNFAFIRFGGGGGGIQCNQSSPIIYNNIIEENASQSAGGIGCGWNSIPTIDNNIIRNFRLK